MAAPRTRSTGPRPTSRPAARAGGDSPGGVTLNLDTLEREGGAAEPFTLVLGGRRYVFLDAGEVDGIELERRMRTSTRSFLELIVPEEDHEAFFANELPLWKLEALGGKYSEHYGLGGRGEGRASSR